MHAWERLLPSPDVSPDGSRCFHFRPRRGFATTSICESDGSEPKQLGIVSWMRNAPPLSSRRARPSIPMVEAFFFRSATSNLCRWI